jgi:hypothetical protein
VGGQLPPKEAGRDPKVKDEDGDGYGEDAICQGQEAIQSLSVASLSQANL